jgi:hypothetical protein
MRGDDVEPPAELLLHHATAATPTTETVAALPDRATVER